MKKLVSAILLAMAALTFLWGAPAMAGDAASGASIFGGNCAACHAGGRNVVNPQKTLQKADLDTYGMNTLEAIVNQVTNGKNAMPAFAGRLTDQQIEDVAAYVLSQAEKGW